MNQHLSDDEMAQWLSGECLAEIERHLRECSQCAAEVEATEKTFALFRDSAQQWGGHWYRVKSAKPAPSSQWRFAGALAACAALCVVSFAIVLRPVPVPRKPAAPEAPFLEMPYVAPLAPYERVEVVRMDVPVAELTAEGLDVRVPDTGATVLADVVLGQDGRAHAIRLVSNQVGSITQ